MDLLITSLQPALAEIFVLCMACVVLLVSLFARPGSQAGYLLTQLTLAGGVFLAALSPDTTQFAFDNQFVADPFAALLKVFICLITAAVLLYARAYLQQRGLFTGEFHVLALFAVLGMMVMVSANHLMTLYLGLELMSLALYAMVALDRDNASATEAAMKYFVLGAMASGLLLYGMSLLYGLTGSLEIAGMSERLQSADADGLLTVFAIAFLVAALAFKLGAAPFHMWLPDVYHGAPAAITLFVSAAPKIAGFALFVRLVMDGLEAQQAGWEDMLILLSVLSLLIGNVVAIAQTNIKRMLAYSAISHMGFVLLGLIGSDQQGIAAALFYILVYALMAAGAFGIIVVLSRADAEAERLEDFRGLKERNPWFAFLMMILMFSMAGVPPTAGFYAKLAVLQAVIGDGHVWLAVYAVVFAIVGAFYYLRVVKLMYFDEPDPRAAATGSASVGASIGLSGNGLMMLALGVMPGGLMAWCLAVVAGF
jgi:NADH-quinone oxidoreductase subunit N